jgi:hypothetical protein
MPYDAHRGRKFIPPLILNLSAGWAWVVIAPPREEAPGHVTGCAPDQVWTGMENKISLAPTAVRTQDSQVLSERTTV